MHKSHRRNKEEQTLNRSVLTQSLSVSTHCPNCTKQVFWEMGLVSTHSLAVSTHCPSLATGSSGIWD
ncbi:hypothetical protein Taro_044168 [Colocasia esculenta]|uniref:Uncharacterized protein n=1 Tax=Colocasia esculenta TaxID=4460 RepID=A0A843WIE8_COLES|nr:hypothetical protein [Colocasia esculenta]